MRRKNITKWFGLGILFIFGVVIACHSEKPDHQAQAERFLQVYYLNIDPQGALAITQGPAKEKMQREVELLRGVSPPESHETPKMKYKILRCQGPASGKFQCDYEIYIEHDVKITRRGKVTLRVEEGQWRVTQFVEELDGP